MERLLPFSGVQVCKHHTTTAYHPASNGLVECFYKSLKVALKAQENPSNWLDNLGLEMLGLRLAYKDDMRAYAVEFTLGKTVRLPGEFFECKDYEPNNVYLFNYTKALSSFVKSLGYIRPRHPCNRRTFIPGDLTEYSHAFIRVDAVRTPLQRSYHGPYPVLQRNNKFFILQVKGKAE